MKFKDWMTRKDWVPVLVEPSLSGELLHTMEGEGRDHRERLGQTLRDLLCSEHLLVLCGSGTSLDLNFKQGRPVNPPVAPSMADLWNVVRIETEAAEVGLFQKVLNYVNYSPARSKENVECLLFACRISERFKSTSWVKNFLDKAEMEIARLCQFPTGQEDLSVHESFLRRLAQRPPELPRTKIFTINYDLCLEKAAANLRYMVLDGFSYGAPREFDISFYGYDWVRRERSADVPGFIPNLVHLYKLHGSVDWEKTPTGVVKNPAVSRPLLLFAGSDHQELILEPPFLELLSQFHVALRQPKTSVLVIGFGFNNNHLALPLLQAVRFNPDLRLVSVASEFPFEDSPCLRSLDHLLDAGDPRLTFLQGSFHELVQLLPVLAAQPKVIPPADSLGTSFRKLCA